MPLHTPPERWIPSLHCMPPPIADSEAGPRKVPNAAEMVPITAPHVHVELTVATGLLRDWTKLSLILPLHHHHSEFPKGRNLSLLCSRMSCRHLEQCLGMADKWHEGPRFFASPCIHTMPFATWLQFLSLKRSYCPFPLNLGCPCDLLCPAEGKQKWWCTILSLDFKRLYMSPRSLLLSAITRSRT